MERRGRASDRAPARERPAAAACVAGERNEWRTSGRNRRRACRRAGGRRAEGFRRRRDLHVERRAHLAAVRGRPQPGGAGGRHPSRAVGDLRRRGLRQTHSAPGCGRADGRPRDHQRGVGGDVGMVQRVAGRRARRTGAARALGGGFVAGARPRPDPRVDHQAGDDAHRSGQGRRGRARRGGAGGRTPPRAGVRRLPARRLRTGIRRGARRRRADGAGSRPGPRCGGGAWRRRSRPPNAQPSLSAATCTGRGRGPRSRPRSSTCACRCSPTGSAGAPCPPTTSWRSSARVVCSGRRPTWSWSSARRSTSGSASGGSAAANVAHVVDAESQRAAHVDAVTVAGDLDAVLRALADQDAPGAGHEAWIDELRAAEGAAREAERPLLAAGRRPDQADPRVRGAAPAARPRRRRDLRRRRLRVVRRQVRRGVRARMLAGHRAVRVSRERHGLRHRRPGGPAGCAGRGPARRRGGRVQPDGRRLVGAPRAPGRDGRRQQRDVGAGEAPDAGDLRLGRGVRPPAGMPLRRGGAARSAGRARPSPIPTRSARRSTAPSPPACPTSSTW